ncbi:hypothetical protein GVN21_11760 [Caulobacter sp. SLTY]|uniref:hypothetical protein n=1 Tax=Caulobacter sp. SLTY TaxID=2683262 RepID=UPI001412D919|nr:hypothetical protein [Caulobacter sp. SLTY]NBB16033.1 hypothetical protein [Caulobacter sp. SLTY]
MTLLAALRSRRLKADLAGYGPAYEADPAAVPALQLAALNAAWTESLARSPWARAQQGRLSLPDSFSSWEQYESLVPVQRKPELRLDVDAVQTGEPEVLWRSTGGTTAEPLRFPVFASETALAGLDGWLGRQRLGIAPDDRLFLIWGHSHLFKGFVTGLKRRLSDAALGYTRWNAYQLTPDDLNRAADALLKSRARYVIGYASALDRFARANAHRAAELRRLNLAAVIATAEGFPRADSRQVVADCFGCPVAMEYGAVETGPMAYERAAGGYDVFWARHRLELVGPPNEAGAREAVVTCLFPRALPLLRYALGDLVLPEGTGEGGLVGLKAVFGRSNEAVTLPDGAVIHSEAFTHTVRDAPGVRAYQIVRRPGALPMIRYEADAPLGEAAAADLRARLARVAPALADTALSWTAAIPPSMAGKHRMVIDEADLSPEPSDKGAITSGGGAVGSVQT